MNTFSRSIYAGETGSFTLPELEGFRSIVAERYRNSSAEDLTELLGEVLSEMTPAEASFFKKALGAIGRTAAKIAPAALPVVGGLIGGPIGGMVGSAAGKLIQGGIPKGGSVRGMVTSAAGKLMQGAIPGVAGAIPGVAGAIPGMLAPQAPQRRSPAGRGAIGRAAPPQPAGDPARQLMQAIQDPQVLQALAAAVAGMVGRKTLPMGESAVPVGAVFNMLESLAARAAVESARTETAGMTPEYMLDEDGEPVGDIGNPDERANVLFGMLEGESVFDNGSDESVLFEDDDELVVEWVD